MSQGNISQTGVNMENVRAKGDIHLHDIHLRQTLGGALADAPPDIKARLEALLGQLEDALRQLPAENREESKKVAKYAGRLIEDAQDTAPDHNMLRVTGQGLLDAAKALAGIAPSVFGMVKGIVETVGELIGG